MLRFVAVPLMMLYRGCPLNHRPCILSVVRVTCACTAGSRNCTVKWTTHIMGTVKKSLATFPYGGVTTIGCHLPNCPLGTGMSQTFFYSGSWRKAKCEKFIQQGKPKNVPHKLKCYIYRIFIKTTCNMRMCRMFLNKEHVQLFTTGTIICCVVFLLKRQNWHFLLQFTAWAFI
jgi:hypothetical protein